MTGIPGQAPANITEAELAEALREIAGRNQADLVPVACPPQTARAIFGIIQDRREPKYEQGRMYQDANGRIWLYQPERNYANAGSWADCPWLKPGDAAAYSLNSPKHPLRKMVPEHAHPDEAAILAEIVAWADSGYVFKDLADRICKLIGAGDE